MDNNNSDLIFPLILLQAKAGGWIPCSGSGPLLLSINSPSGEGGGAWKPNPNSFHVGFPLILLQAKAGGKKYQLQ